MPLQPQDIGHLPEQPGVYLFKDHKGGILYIGKAKNIKKRVAQYFAQGSVWKQDMVIKAYGVDFFVVANESEALYLEDNLIKKHKPHFNSLLKGDNSYIFVKITRHPFPEIFLTRYRKNDGALYIGPKHNSRELRKFLQRSRLLLQYRGCKTQQFNTGKLCSDYFFGLCKGRCVFAKLQQKNADQYRDLAAHYGLHVDQPYDHYVKESKDMISLIQSFFRGNTKLFAQEIKKHIQQCIETQNFEHAAKMRDIFMHIESWTEKQNVVLETSVSGTVGKLIVTGERYILVLTHYFEGRLTDVITQKYPVTDMSLHTFLSGLENDLGGLIFPVKDWHDADSIQHLEQSVSTTGIVFFSQSIKPFSQKRLQEINEMLQKYIDSYVHTSVFEKENVMNDLLSQLQTEYKRKNFPYRMECIDISHLSGGRMSGGLSCLVSGIPYKKHYRKYRIKTVKEKNQTAGYSNDYASLEEVLRRRFANASVEELPDICIIDGGKGQLGVVQQLISQDPKFAQVTKSVQFASLGKGDARKRAGKVAGEQEKIFTLLPDGSMQEFSVNYSSADRLLIQLRDEAHRFANAYRKKQMEKEWE